MNILNELLMGWKSGVMGRLKFFLYSIGITFIMLSTGLLSIIYNHNLFVLFLFCVVVFLGYYCIVLIAMKRYRELVPFPFISVVIHFGAWSLAIGEDWQWLNLVCGIIFLFLMVAPARRFINDENPS
ncbi:hypothetical protein [Citrobacter amalonaticus]|uniref:hypothetical protein n=1 Tax=Citrobacter amalonaticus TaxID=35703 RepID=UPI00300C8405